MKSSGICGFVTITVAGPLRIYTGFPLAESSLFGCAIILHDAGLIVHPMRLGEFTEFVRWVYTN